MNKTKQNLKVNRKLFPLINIYLIYLAVLTMIIINAKYNLIISTILGMILPICTNYLINYGLLLLQSDKIRLVIHNLYRVLMTTSVFLFFYFVFKKAYIIDNAISFIVTYSITIGFVLLYYKFKGDDKH